MVELEDILLDAVRAVGLPVEEPLAQWLAEPDTTGLSIGVDDHKLRIDRCVYEVLPSGAVLVFDYRDPRSTRSQMYQPGRPQPYMPPSVEERGPGWQ